MIISVVVLIPVTLAQFPSYQNWIIENSGDPRFYFGRLFADA